MPLFTLEVLDFLRSSLERESCLGLPASPGLCGRDLVLGWVTGGQAPESQAHTVTVTPAASSEPDARCPASPRGQLCAEGVQRLRGRPAVFPVSPQSPRRGIWIP